MKRLIAILGLSTWVCAASWAQDVTNFCGPMDVVLVVDDTGSMGGAIDNVRQGLANIISTADAASGGDVRYGLVSFGVGIQVDQPFTCNFSDITAAVNALAATGGDGEPEDSDAALQYVITGATASVCVVSEPAGALGAFRPNALKIAVLITDARPAGCDDEYEDGVDDVQAELVAGLAASNGVLISAILVDDGSRVITPAHPTGVEQEVMEKYATISGGFSTVVPSAGDGTGDSIATIIANCGGGQTTTSTCTTRPARFWFTHPDSADPSCVTLKKVFESCGGVDLGFIALPVEFRTPDYVKDADDAVIEALGLYWRNQKKTGEGRGLQDLSSPGSKLCQGRKSLAVELIAALGNTQLLGAAPAQCTYFNGVVVTNFPADLIRQARLTAGGDDVEAIEVMTALLRKFNSNGQTNNFPTGLVECSGDTSKALRDRSRDPTTQQSCPGINDSCDSAYPITFRKPTDIFSKATFTGKASLLKYSDSFPFAPLCDTGGADAVWRLSPTIALPGRSFTVTATGNMAPVVSVWSAASGNCSNLVDIICGSPAPGINSAEAKFRTDGTNTYFIVLEGAGGAIGNGKIRVTSP